MGFFLNSHGGFTPEEKSLAERCAVVRARALGSVIQGLAYFDEAGQYFWAGDREASRSSMMAGFQVLQGARDELDALTDLDLRLFALYPTRKVEKAAELGLHWPTEQFKEQALTGDRRVIAGIEHLLLLQEAAVAGIASNDLKPAYTAVASAARHLGQEVVAHLSQVIGNSRLTHELSDIVNRQLVAEQVVTPEFEFTGPKER